MDLIPIGPTIWANITPLKYNPFTYGRVIEKESSEKYFGSDSPGSTSEPACFQCAFIGNPDRF
jgi:hypothetical protein